MKYNQLIVSKNTDRTRAGRGISAGRGKTAGRGTKGQKSRTGHHKLPASFMAKMKGFKSIHAKAQVVYTDTLNAVKGKADNFTLAEANLIADPFAKVKVITRGEITSKIELETQFASKTAIEAIKKAGGSFKKVAVPARKKAEKEDK